MVVVVVGGEEEGEGRRGNGLGRRRVPGAVTLPPHVTHSLTALKLLYDARHRIVKGT